MDETPPEVYALLTDQISKISDAMHTDQPIIVLEETDILLQTLDEEYIKNYKLGGLKKQITHLLDTPEINRALRLNARVKEENETAIEYYDEDIGNDERLLYQEDLERTLVKTYSDIRRLLATLINTKFKEEIKID